MSASTPGMCPNCGQPLQSRPPRFNAAAAIPDQCEHCWAEIPSGARPVERGGGPAVQSVAVRTASELYHGNVYARAGAAATQAVVSGTAIRVMRQLTDVMSIGTDSTTEVDQLVALAKEKAPDAQPFLVLIDARTSKEFREWLLVVSTFLGLCLQWYETHHQPPPAEKIEIQITNLHRNFIEIEQHFRGSTEPDTPASRPGAP